MVMKAGAPFDILTIHPYRGHLDEAGFIKELKDTAALTRAAGGDAKPVWITEMGLPTQLYGGLSERNQATFLARCYLSALASGVDTNVSWYDFREDGANPFYNEHRFGVVRHPDMTPKPGLRALASVCRALAGQKVRRKIDLGSGVQAYLFTGDGKETAAVWSPATDQVCGVKVAGEAIAITDLMGNPVNLAKLGGEMALALRAASPVFITGRGLRVERSAPRLQVEAPASAHAKDIVRVVLRGSPVSAKLTPPKGWKVSAAGPGAFDVVVPGSAGQGQYEMLLSAGGRGGLSLPVSIEIIPPVLRL